MSAGQREPRRSLGLLDATMVGMGAMIGAGIFVLTGLAARVAGPAAIFVFLLNGIVTAFTALSYAELASAIPESGGGYAYVKEVFAAGPSFLMGWMLWFAYTIAGALYAIGFGANFVEFLRIFGVGIPRQLTVVGVTLPLGELALGLLVVVVFATLNAVSTSASGGAETLVTLVKVAILLIFAGFGAFAVETENFTPLFTEGPLAVLPAMGLTFIAFEGYDLIATITEEVKNPRKNIPRAIFISLLVTVAVYLVVVFVAIGTLGAEQLGAAGETAIARAAAGFMPTFPVIGSGVSVIAFGAVFSTMSALNAVVLASSRVAFAMGRENQLPQKMGRVHHRFGTPLWAVLASCLVMFVAVAFIPIRQVGNLSSLFFLLSFVVVNASLIRLRREAPDIERPYEVPFYPVPPVLGMVLNLGIGLYFLVTSPRTWALAVGWLALGGLVYLGLAREGGE